jgi:hypothetical protein
LLPSAGVGAARVRIYGTVVTPGALQQPQGLQSLVVVQGLEYITVGGHCDWLFGRRHQSAIRHPAAPLNKIATDVKISNFFIFRFSHRNGIVTGENFAKKLYTTLNDVQTQRGCF